MDKKEQVIKCYTCIHRFYSDANGFNPYCETRCGDYWQGYEPEEDENDMEQMLSSMRRDQDG